MEGLRAQFSAKLGPLPVWAWALLAVLAVLAWMYFTKSGFFSTATADNTPGPQDTAGDQGVGSNSLPVGLGGLAGGGTPTPSTSISNPLPGAYDPSQGAFTGPGSSSGNTGSNAGGGGLVDLSNVGAPVPVSGGPSYSPATTGGGRYGVQNVNFASAIPIATSIPALNVGNPVSSYGRGN